VDANYRSSIDAFVKATEWAPPTASAKAGMRAALQWYCANVPADVLDKPLPSDTGGGRIALRPGSGRWTMLMSWMRCVDFTRPVYPNAPVRKGDKLKAFKGARLSVGADHFGNFFTLLDESHSRLGIADVTNKAHLFEAKVAFTTLKTTAGDAFLDWTSGDEQRYGHGGGVQYFIFQAPRVLRLLERESHVGTQPAGVPPRR
jgi:hypothetical protein